MYCDWIIFYLLVHSTALLSKVNKDPAYKTNLNFLKGQLIFENVSAVKSFDELTDIENKRVQYDCIAKNIITSALNMVEFFRVS